MKAKWMAWSMAAALCAATFVATAMAQERPAPGALEGTASDRADDPEDFGGLDLLLAAGLGSGPGPGMGHGPGAGMGPGMHRGPGMGAGRPGAAELHKKLNLTDDQKAKLADIHDRTQRAAIPLRADLRIARLDLGKLMRADKPDSRAIDAQIDRIASLRGSMQKGHVAGMLEARGVLTPAQQKLLREERGGMMGRGLHGGRGLRGGRGLHGGPGMRMRHL
jgi:Spy/CpxP family protein refolding chaperone